MTTIEDLIKLIDKEGIERVRGALSALNYLIIPSSPDPIAPDDVLSLGSISVCDISGNPIVGHQVTIEPMEQGDSVTINNKEYYSSLIYSPKIILTNGEGTASIHLLKGTKVRVYLEGSSLIRQITVPDQDFNFLDASISDIPDAFSSPIAAPKLVIRGDL